MVLIELFTKDQCVLCETAKTKLREKNVPFNEYVVGRDISREKVLEQFPGRRSVPIILVDGVEITDPTSFQMLLEG